MTKLTKDQIAKELVKYDITLSPSQVKKTPIAELEQQLVDAINAAAAKEKIDLDQDPTPDEPRAAANVVPIAAAEKRKSAGVNLPAKPASQLRACRAGSKQAILIDHLANGATLAELVAALKPWTQSSVKSALYWDVAKVKGYGVRTETSDDGTQRYHLVLPKGVEAPLRHVEPASVKMAANRR
jgi:hypothetical protein